MWGVVGVWNALNLWCGVDTTIPVADEHTPRGAAKPQAPAAAPDSIDRSTGFARACGWLVRASQLMCDRAPWGLLRPFLRRIAERGRGLQPLAGFFRCDVHSIQRATASTTAPIERPATASIKPLNQSNRSIPQPPQSTINRSILIDPQPPQTTKPYDTGHTHAWPAHPASSSDGPAPH